MPSIETTASRTASESSSGAGLSIAILALAGFVIVTTEFLIIGLLPSLARDLGISISAAGLLVTLFAFTVMLFGPPLTAMLSHLDRKRTFIVILLIFAASNALAAVSSNIWVLALARFIPALALPVFWAPRAKPPVCWPDPNVPARQWRRFTWASRPPCCSVYRSALCSLTWSAGGRVLGADPVVCPDGLVACAVDAAPGTYRKGRSGRAGENSA